ncbi:MAG TPA: GNAT family N-acetyltransferase [Caulobacteraceae bacterium]|nr:GNAT family N-acetyltransferase [Caulobacteraceae bacterium]
MGGRDGEPSIRLAATAADYEAFGRLCRAYFDWGRARYRDVPWFVDEVFGHQSFADELDALSSKYGPPAGRTMIAETDEGAVAAGAWRRFADGVCELKRLYVSDSARGLGLGRQLTEALIASAKAAGFTQMRLDTGDRLTEAIALYESMGFERIAPYQTYPARLMPHLVFMQRPI